VFGTGYLAPRYTISVRLHTQFLISAASAQQFPAPRTPEVAFLGRSNVGKSSLINALLGEKVAKTSSTPGRTRTINFFSIRRPGQPQPDVIFADLPGYGYAKLPRELTAEWPKFIEPYLQERPNLALCIVLVDTNIAPQPSDKQMIEYLQQTGRSYLVVGTKSDRISSNVLLKNTKALLEGHAIERMLPFSTKTGKGKDELWQEIRAACERARSGPDNDGDDGDDSRQQQAG
jgi:GTP-binding protein